MTEYPPLNPPISPSLPPPFYDMNEHPKRFERLSAYLLSKDEALAGADLFGVDGVAQFGIDVIAKHRAGPGRDVLSCKCRPKITASKVRAWSDDFLNEWERRWRAQNVQRFVLVTAALDVTHVDVLAQRDVEVERFQKLGVTYELWGPEELTRRLMGDRPGVTRFLGDAWADQLCGRPVGLDAAGVLAVTRAHSEQLRSVADSLTVQVTARVATARHALREGNVDECRSVISELKTGASWDQLGPGARAGVLRMEARLASQDNDLGRAEDLCAEADTLDGGEPVLAAHIVAARSGSRAGLEKLGKPQSIAARQLQAGLLIELGELDAASAAVASLVAEDAASPETQRLLGWVRLLQGDRRAALEAANIAEGLAPGWVAIKRLAATVRYANALSPWVDVGSQVQPTAINPMFVKSDGASVAALKEALRRFDDLLLKNSFPDLAYWKMACLANLPGRDTEAQAYCRSWLDIHPGDARMLEWVNFRGFEYDTNSSLAKLMQLFEEGVAEPDQPQVIAWLMGRRDGSVAAAEYLERHLPKQSIELKRATSRVIGMLRDTLLDEAEDSDETVEGIVQVFGSDPAEVDWTSIGARLDNALGGAAPLPAGLGLADAVAQRGRWSLLKRHADAIAGFETAHAVMLAAHVVHRTGKPRDVLTLLERHGGVFPGGELPIELRRMQVLGLQWSDPPKAIENAERIAAETRDIHDRLQLVLLHLAAGHVQAAAPLIRVSLDEHQLPAPEALRFSTAMTREDPALSKDLWREAMSLGIPDALLLTTLNQAYLLGLDREAQGLMPRL